MIAANKEWPVSAFSSKFSFVKLTGSLIQEEIEKNAKKSQNIIEK